MKEKNLLCGIFLVFVFATAVNATDINTTNDTMPPTIYADIYPDTGDYSTITANVTDNGGIHAIILLTNGAYTDIKYCNGSLFCDWAMAVYRYVDGFYTYTIRAWDLNGNNAMEDLYANYSVSTTTTTTTASPTTTTTTMPTCFDSDGGPDIYVKGTVITNIGNTSDSCVDSNTIAEWTCGSLGTPDMWQLLCPVDYVCIDGACVFQTTTTTTTTTTIPQNTCFDSDGGLNIYVRGNVSGVLNGSYSYTYSDSCSTPNIVYEWVCGEFNMPDIWTVYCNTSYVCMDGACVFQTTTTTTTTTSTTTTTLPGCLLTTCNRRNASTDVALIQPSTNWKKVSGSLISRSDTKRYKVNITTLGRYEFSLCPSDGGNASYDSWLCLLNERGTLIRQNDDYCGLKSKIIYNITSIGTYYIQVSGYGYGYGSYTLAYRRNA